MRSLFLSALWAGLLLAFPSPSLANKWLHFLMQGTGKPLDVQGSGDKELARLENRRKEVLARLEAFKQRTSTLRETWQREMVWFQSIHQQYRTTPKRWLWQEASAALRTRLEVIQLADECISILDKLPSAHASRDQSLMQVYDILESYISARQSDPKLRPRYTPEDYPKLREGVQDLRRRIKKTRNSLKVAQEEFRAIDRELENNQAELDRMKRRLLSIPEKQPTSSWPVPPTEAPTSQPSSPPSSLPSPLLPPSEAGSSDSRDSIGVWRQDRSNQETKHTFRRLQFEYARLRSQLLQVRRDDESLEQEVLLLRLRLSLLHLSEMTRALNRISRMVVGGLFYYKPLSITAPMFRRVAEHSAHILTAWPRDIRLLQERSQKRLHRLHDRVGLWWLAFLGCFFALVGSAWFLLRRLITKALAYVSEQDRAAHEPMHPLWRLLDFGLRILWSIHSPAFLFFALWPVFWIVEPSPQTLRFLQIFALALLGFFSLWTITSRLFSSPLPDRLLPSLSEASSARFRRVIRRFGFFCLLYLPFLSFLRDLGYPEAWLDLLFVGFLSILLITSIVLLSDRDAIINLLPTNNFLERLTIVLTWRLFPLFFLLLPSLFGAYVWGYRNAALFALRGLVGSVAVVALHYAAYWVLWSLILLVYGLSQADDASLQTNLRRESRLATLTGALLGFVLAVFALGFLLEAWKIPGGFAALPRLLQYPLAQFQDKPFTFLSLLYFIFVLTIAIWISRALPVKMNEMVYPILSLTEGAQYAINTLIAYLVLILGFLVGLQVIGAGLGGFLVFFGVVGIGIGFGLQDIANNFISGMIIIFGRPISIGDYIEIGEHSGRVRRITARSTTLETLTRRHIILPNSAILNSNVVNWSSGPYVRDKIFIEVAYGTDTDLVVKTLKEIGLAHKDVVAKPVPIIRLREINHNSMHFSLSVTCPTPTSRFRILSELRMATLKRFQELGIKVAFQQQQIHLEPELESALASLLSPSDVAPPGSVVPAGSVAPAGSVVPADSVVPPGGRTEANASNME